MFEKSKLEFNDDGYSYERTRNFGEMHRRVKGSVSTKQIATFSKSDGIYGRKEQILSQKVLDEDGFVIKENIDLSNGAKKSIKRNGVYISSAEGKSIRWDGNPLELNEKSKTAKIFLNNMLHTIGKYPNTQGYYENLVGKEIVLQALENVRAKN